MPLSEAGSLSSSTRTSSGISFKILLGAIALAFASAAVLSTLLTNLHFGDAARNALLSRAVTDAASLSAINIETTINLTYNDVRSMGESLLLLGKLFRHSSPFTVNPSNSSDYLVEPVALQSYSRLYTAAVTKIHLTRFNSAGSNFIITRWADGTGSYSTDAFDAATKTPGSGGAFNFYRSAFGGFYTGVDGLDLHVAGDSEHFAWNLTTLEDYPTRPFNERIAMRTGVNGVFWTLAQHIEGSKPKPTPWKRIPTYTKLAHIEAMFFGFPVMIYEDDGTTPFVVVTMFLIAPQYAYQLRRNLLHADAGTSSSSFAYLVDRRNGIVLAQAGPEETYECRPFVPGTTHVDRNCFTFAPARSMGCMKNVSTAPEFAPLRALLADSDDVDTALASDHPRLSSADVGGDLVVSTITGEDGIEYYATAETLRLPVLVDLQLSLMTFTPRDLFAGKAIQARNVAIGISVVISFVAIVLLEVLLFFIGSAVSELAEQMSDPLQSVALAAAAESDLSQSSAKSIGARVLRVLSNVQELHEVQETFDFCIARIRLLRGFVSKASLAFLTAGDGFPTDTSRGEMGTSSAEELLSGSAGSADTEIQQQHSVDGSPTETTKPERRRVRFRESPVVDETEQQKSDTDAAVATAAAAAAAPESLHRYPIEQQLERSKTAQRFCCISVSFPFIGRIVEMVAGSGSTASSDHQMLFEAVGAAAQASSNIMSKAHATSIEELSTVGDEMLCCFRLRTTKVSRTRLLNRVLIECVAASFELQKKMGRKIKRKEKRKNLGHQQKQLLSLPLFVAVGAASGNVLSLNHHQVASAPLLPPASPPASPVENEPSSSSSFLLRPVSIVGGAVPLSHLIQRRMCAASGTLIFQHDEFVLAVRDSPSFTVPWTSNVGVEEVSPFYRSEPDISGDLTARDSPSFSVPWTSNIGVQEMNEAENEQQQQESTAPSPLLGRRTVFSVPFSIGITRDLLQVVTPDFVAVESVASPERCAALLKQDDVQVGDTHLLPKNVFDDDDAEERDVFCRQSVVSSRYNETVDVFRVVPVEMDDVEGL